MNPSENDSPEFELITRAIGGDTDAFGELYDLHLDAIYTFIYYQVSDVQEAEDLAETVFLKAFEKLPDFRSEKSMINFQAWIYRIARNLVIDHYRTRKSVVTLNLELPLASKEPALEHQVQVREEVAKVLQALTGLEGLFREVLTLRLINGLTYGETANTLGITQNYVRVIQFRALKQLREILVAER